MWRLAGLAVALVALTATPAAAPTPTVRDSTRIVLISDGAGCRDHFVGILCRAFERSIAAARAAWLVAVDPEDDARRLFLPVKNNLARAASGLAYSIVDFNEIGRVEWNPEPVEFTAEEVLSRRPSRRNERVAAAKDYLCELLKDGPMRSKDIEELVKQSEHSWRTVRRAQGQLGIKPFRRQFDDGEWYWGLPETN